MVRNRALIRLLGGFALVNVAEWGFVAVLSVHAYRIGGPLDVGLIGLRFLAGAVSSAVIAPLFASRRGALSVVALLRAILLGIAALVAITGAPFVLVLTFVVLDSIVAAVYRPAQARLMPSLARSPQELTHAVAGTSITKTIGQAAGALLGAGALALLSPPHAMAYGAAVMLLALLCTLGIGGTPAFDADAESRGLAQGLRAFPSVLRDDNAWPLVLASVLRTLVRGLWSALLVVVALRLLHSSSSSVGLLQAAAGVGAFMALPVTATQIGRSRLALPCVASFVAVGLLVGLVGASQTLPVVAVLVFIWGASMAVADAMSLSLLHRLLPIGAFSRTVGVMESLKLVTEGAGALLAPALVALFGMRTALIIAGVPLPLLMVSTWSRVRHSDELAAGRGATVALLHRVGLFRGLDMASIEQLAASAETVELGAGEQPITQGEYGDRFYVIADGSADVIINDHTVRQIGVGDDFGERALLRNTPRTATVRALSDMTLLAVEREAFLTALTGESGMRFEYRDLLDAPLAEVLGGLAVFEGVGGEGLRRLARASHRRELDAGTVVCDVGEHSQEAHVILDGRVELRRDGAVSAVLVPGDIYGELSVLHATPWPAQAVVSEAAVVAVLPAAAMLAEVNGHSSGAGHSSSDGHPSSA